MASRASGCRKAARPGSCSTIRPPARSSSRPGSQPSAATRSMSKRLPATEIASALVRARSERSPARRSTASRIVWGSGTSASSASSRPASPDHRRPPDSSAPASSSTKNGMPPVRSCNIPASRGERVSPSACSARAVVPRALSGASVSSPSRRFRRRSSRSRRTWWVRGISSDRYAPTTSMGSSRSGAASQASSSSVAASDHWRSSRSTTAGRSATTAASPQRIASNNVARSVAWLGAPSSGRSSASCGRRGPHRESPPGTARRKARRAATTGS